MQDFVDVTEDLSQLAAGAADLFVKKHGWRLRPTEQVSVYFFRKDGEHRVVLQILDSNSGELLELRADVAIKKQTATALALDFLDGVLEEILDSEREAYPPLDPEPYSFEGQTVLLSGGIRRPDLEAAADRLLAEN